MRRFEDKICVSVDDVDRAGERDTTGSERSSDDLSSEEEVSESSEDDAERQSQDALFGANTKTAAEMLSPSSRAVAGARTIQSTSSAAADIFYPTRSDDLFYCYHPLPEHLPEGFLVSSSTSRSTGAGLSSATGAASPASRRILRDNRSPLTRSAASTSRIQNKAGSSLGASRPASFFDLQFPGHARRQRDGRLDMLREDDRRRQFETMQKFRNSKTGRVSVPQARTSSVPAGLGTSRNAEVESGAGVAAASVPLGSFPSRAAVSDFESLLSDITSTFDNTQSLIKARKSEEDSRYSLYCQR